MLRPLEETSFVYLLSLGVLKFHFLCEDFSCIHCLLLGNKGCGDIEQWHIEQLAYQIEDRNGYSNGSKFSRT
jgi:hypothetical protein